MRASYLWIAVYLILLAVPLFLMLVPPRPTSLGFAWDSSIALGFVGTTMMAIQFALTARFRRATAPFGIDVIYYFHRYVAVIGFSLIVIHPVILFAINPGLLPMLNPFDAPAHLVAGLGSVIALVLLIASSIFRKSFRLEYEYWRMGHGVLAIVALTLAIVHIHGVHYFTEAEWKRGIWTGILISAAALFIYVRVIKPWLLIHKPYRVTNVREERGNSWTITVEPDGHRGITFQPGQFAWLTLRGSPFALKEHPFSISSSPAISPRLEFTIKELGDFTATIGQVRPGEKAFVDGPYGTFTIDRYRFAPGFVLIAGGIGLAPVMSMLRAMADHNDRRPVLVICANSHWERVSMREALYDLKSQLSLTIVHVLEDPPQDWKGESGFVTRAVLERNLPVEARAFEYFVCGPPGMIHSVEKSLHQIGVPMKRTHTELFDLV